MKHKYGEKTKWNFATLKLEYFEADEMEVKAFFENHYNCFSRYLQDMTVGWTAEKKKRNMRIVNKVLAQAENKEIRDLRKGLKNIRAYFLLKVASPEKLDKLTVKSAARIWQVLRTENNLPTHIMKSTNYNHDVEAEEKAFDDLDKKIEDDTTKNQITSSREIQDIIEGESGRDL